MQFGISLKIGSTSGVGVGLRAVCQERQLMDVQLTRFQRSSKVVCQERLSVDLKLTILKRRDISEVHVNEISRWWKDVVNNLEYLSRGICEDHQSIKYHKTESVGSLASLRVLLFVLSDPDCFSAGWAFFVYGPRLVLPHFLSSCTADRCDRVCTLRTDKSVPFCSRRA